MSKTMFMTVAEQGMYVPTVLWNTDRKDVSNRSCVMNMLRKRVAFQHELSGL